LTGEESSKNTFETTTATGGVLFTLMETDCEAVCPKESVTANERT
jgi:hypothetical protein